MTNPPTSADAAPQAALSALSHGVYAQLSQLCAQPQSAENLNDMLRLLAKWRSGVIANTIVKKDGAIVQSGPFAGLKYLSGASEGSAAARLLGSYEASLHPVIEEICAAPYRQIFDIGCAEGYYAVGLARRIPTAKVYAHDSNPSAREKCAQLAALNGLSARVQVGGTIGHGDLASCAAIKTLIVCDIEGAEDQLLNPERAPALAHADILVEAHDCFSPGISAQLAQRFTHTHQVRILDRALFAGPLPGWMDGLGDLDRLLATWEWRIGPTPWLWMTAKNGPADAA